MTLLPGYMEKEMAAHASVLTWRIPWTEEPGGLQSIQPGGAARVRHALATKPVGYKELFLKL